MASRFDAIMMNVAPDAKVKMFMEIEVGRYEPLSMAQFLARVNIPKMLRNVADWDKARFSFTAHGISQETAHATIETFNIRMEPYNYTLEELPGALQEAFDDAGEGLF